MTAAGQSLPRLAVPSSTSPSLSLRQSSVLDLRVSDTGVNRRGGGWRVRGGGDEGEAGDGGCLS